MNNKQHLLIFMSVLVISCKQEPLPEVPARINHFNHQIFEENRLLPRATFLGLNQILFLIRKV